MDPEDAQTNIVSIGLFQTSYLHIAHSSHVTGGQGIEAKEPRLVVLVVFDSEV